MQLNKTRKTTMTYTNLNKIYTSVETALKKTVKHEEMDEMWVEEVHESSGPPCYNQKMAIKLSA